MPSQQRQIGIQPAASPGNFTFSNNSNRAILVADPRRETGRSVALQALWSEIDGVNNRSA